MSIASTSFDDFGFSSKLAKAIKDLGYTAPTLIQEKAIPQIMAKRDIMAVAQTGTGKTAAFTLPILEELSKTRATNRAPRALILTPTRELAAQVYDNVMAYSKHLHLRTVALYGGVRYEPQIGKLRRGVDVVVATPGRLRDHMDQNNVDLSRLQILVLDEADRMLDMGFLDEVQRIIEDAPQERQTLLFSATLSNEVKGLAQRFLKEPLVIHTSPQNMTAQSVEHMIHPVDRSRKMDLMVHLTQLYQDHQILVFTRTKAKADEISDELTARGIYSMAIHGDRSQSQRTRALARFKEGKIQVLVATDVAARGIDIHKLSFVVNFEIPNVPEDYVHRIGRTGRAGAAGTAISLVSREELYFLAPIERLIKSRIPQVMVEGFSPKNFDTRRAAPQGKSGERKGKSGAWGKKPWYKKSESGSASGSKKKFSSPGQRPAKSPSSPGQGSAKPRKKTVHYFA